MGIETALVGLGVGAKTAASIASVASIASTGFSIFSGLSDIAGGFSSRSEASNQSELAIQQAESRAIEQERVAARESRLEQEQADEARKRQKVAYLASGVTLEGSPLLIMEETRQKGAENVAEIKQAGSASANSIREEGRIQASQLESSGRQAFSSGLSSGVRSIAGGLEKYA
jgi:hypothetical protein